MKKSIKLKKSILTDQLEELMRLCGYVYAYPDGTPYINRGSREIYGTRFRNKENDRCFNVFYDDKNLEILIGKYEYSDEYVYTTHLEYLLYLFEFKDEEN